MIYLLCIIKLGCQSVGSGGVMGKGLYLLIMVACGTIGKKHVLQQKLKNTGWVFYFYFFILTLHCFGLLWSKIQIQNIFILTQYSLIHFLSFSSIAAVICHYTDVFQVASHPTFESVGKSGAEQLVAFPFLILMAFIL